MYTFAGRESLSRSSSPHTLVSSSRLGSELARASLAAEVAEAEGLAEGEFADDRLPAAGPDWGFDRGFADGGLAAAGFADGEPPRMYAPSATRAWAGPPTWWSWAC